MHDIISTLYGTLHIFSATADELSVRAVLRVCVSLIDQSV